MTHESKKHCFVALISSSATTVGYNDRFSVPSRDASDTLGFYGHKFAAKKTSLFSLCCKKRLPKTSSRNSVEERLFTKNKGVENRRRSAGCFRHLKGLPSRQQVFRKSFGYAYRVFYRVALNILFDIVPYPGGPLIKDYSRKLKRSMETNFLQAKDCPVRITLMPILTRT